MFFDRVAIWPQQFVIPMHYFPSLGPFRWWGKQGIEVKAGREPVDLTVPRFWRDRVTITWGDSGGRQGASVVRILGCEPSPSEEPPNPWWAYPGGFFAREPLCLPLVVRVGNRRAFVPVAVGKPCPPGSRAFSF